ncbi:MAG: bile acid:sodium symporter [Proteobacteria bacterium]|nr:bile acid:sodium symporter [Pseudomonadota bacterium]
MVNLLKKYWFLLGLLIVFILTLKDSTETIARTGLFLKAHHGADIAIVLIFFIYGLTTHASELKSGINDIQGLGIGLFNIFIIAPVIAAVFMVLPLPEGLIIGIFIVSVMPTTLSSGVVMTGAAGGNIAHALLITLTANILSVFTIPVILAFLLSLYKDAVSVNIDKLAIMIKIGLLVVLPLIAGLGVKKWVNKLIETAGNFIQQLNQLFVIAIVWMSLSQTKPVILGNMDMVPRVFLAVLVFHVMLLLSAFLLTRLFKIPSGRRESVIFMGSQKTLPLSVIIQVTLFPQYGMALIVCVLHHIVHLFIDSYLVGKLKRDSSVPLHG